MYVSVNLEETPATVALAEPDDFGRLHVQVAAGGLVKDGKPVAGVVEHLCAALEETGVGMLAGEDSEVFLTFEALRSLAAKAGTEDGWDEKFGKMIEYARTKGWVSPDGNSVRAHIIWEG